MGSRNMKMAFISIVLPGTQWILDKYLWEINEKINEWIYKKKHL